MIVWVASFARSGNTFLRILLHQVHGLPTYSGFASGDDISRDFPDRNPTGHAALPAYLLEALDSDDRARIEAALERLDAEEQVYFIKTHCLIEELYHNRHRAILLVRDGRDALVSFGWYVINVLRTLPRLATLPATLRTPWRPRKLAMLAAATVQTLVIEALKRLGLRTVAWRAVVSRFGFLPPDTWSRLNEGWLQRPGATTVVVRFEDLVTHPLATLGKALDELGLDLPQATGPTPTFEELKRLHPQFFRAGRIGGWREELPAPVAERFVAANRACLERFGYLDVAHPVEAAPLP